MAGYPYRNDDLWKARAPTRDKKLYRERCTMCGKIHSSLARTRRHWMSMYLADTEKAHHNFVAKSLRCDTCGKAFAQFLSTNSRA
jgi:phage FluMu protein Com